MVGHSLWLASKPVQFKSKSKPMSLGKVQVRQRRASALVNDLLFFVEHVKPSKGFSILLAVYQVRTRLTPEGS